MSGKVVSPIGDVDSYIAYEGDKLVTGTEQDCAPYLERARRMHNEGQHGSSEMRLAASYPAVLVERYCNDSGIDFAEFLRNPAHGRRMMGDPDLSGFRIWPGRVG